MLSVIGMEEIAVLKQKEQMQDIVYLLGINIVLLHYLTNVNVLIQIVLHLASHAMSVHMWIYVKKKLNKFVISIFNSSYLIT
jgi:hypothetical protein